MEANEKILPNFVQYSKGISSVLSIDKQNCFIVYNGNFNVLEIIDIDKIEIKEATPGFSGSKYFTDNKSFIWSKQGRGFYSIDLSTKKTKHIIVSHDGDSEIRQTFIIDPQKQLFYIEQLTIGMTTDRSYSKYYIYDFTKDEIVFTSDKFKGNHYPLTNNSMLMSEFFEKTKVKWYVTDLKMMKKIENDLTNKLTELQFSITVDEQSYNLKKHFMLGLSEIKNPLSGLYDMYTVNWNNEMKDVKAAPLTFQIPNDYLLTGSCFFSSDGAWLKTRFSPQPDGIPVTVFFNINDKYPQGLSLPVFGGNTVLENPGCFVNHTKFGPLYVEMDSDHENVLLIYRLNDCFEILRKKAVGK